LHQLDELVRKIHQHEASATLQASRQR
jgi:hypothetical protein